MTEYRLQAQNYTKPLRAHPMGPYTDVVSRGGFEPKPDVLASLRATGRARILPFHCASRSTSFRENAHGSGQIRTADLLRVKELS